MSIEEAQDHFGAVCASLSARDLQTLRKLYPRPLVRPGAHPDSTMFSAGAASVIDDIIAKRAPR